MDMVQEQAMLLVCNTDLFPYERFQAVKLAQVLKVSEHMRRGKVVAVVWECDNRGLANLQAELLWEKGLPVRVVENEQQRDSFIQEIFTGKHA